MQITINQKKYDLSNNWNFKEFNKLNALLAREELSLFGIMKRPDVFMLATCMIMLATGQEYEEASDTLTQHVEGGGDFTELATSFSKGLESDFFQKMISKVDENSKSKTKLEQKAEK